MLQKHQQINMSTDPLYERKSSLRARKKSKRKSKHQKQSPLRDTENIISSAETVYTETEFDNNYDKYYYHEDSSPVENYDPTESSKFTQKNTFDDSVEIDHDEALQTTTFEKNKMFLLYQLWLFSHLSTIVTFFVYFRNVILKKNVQKNNNFAYLTCLSSSMWTYSLVLYRIYTTKQKTLLFTNRLTENTMMAILPLSCLFQTENFHLIVNCSLFLLSNHNKSIFKLASFAIFSWLNLANFLLYEFKNTKIEEDNVLNDENHADEETENNADFGTLQKIKDAFKPLLHLVAKPLLFLITVIDMYQFINIYKIDIQNADNTQDKILGVVVLSVYTVNYLLRLEYVENSRFFVNFLTYQLDTIIGEQLYTLLTQNSVVMNANQSLKLDNANEMSTASKVCYEISNFMNSFWFNWCRHGINILVPLNAVNDNILKNQQHVITNVEYFGILSNQKVLSEE